MEIRTLKGIGMGALVKVFNTSFADYAVPLQFTEQQLEAKMIADQTDLELSVGVVEQGQWVAFILHGTKTVHQQKSAYNGGTGVVPTHRGQGLTQRMYRYSIPLLAANGVEKIVLEVLGSNHPAIRSYQNTGFRTQRELQCYQGKITGSKNAEPVSVVPLEAYPWPLLKTFWDVDPTWQNSELALQLLQPTNVALGAFIHNTLVGYVVYRPNNNRIQQLAVHKEYRRRGVGTALVLAVIQRFGPQLSVINVDKAAKGMHDFFLKMGLTPTVEQLEMAYFLR